MRRKAHPALLSTCFKQSCVFKTRNRLWGKGVCVIVSVMAGCKEDLMQDNDAYKKCIITFTNYMQASLGDPSQLVNVMCGKTGKKKLECVMGYAKECPELFDSAAGSTDIFGQVKNLDAMCAMVHAGMGGNTGGTHGGTHGGGPTTSFTGVHTGGDIETPDNTCMQVYQCMKSGMKSGGSPDAGSPDSGLKPRARTPFSDIQQMMASLCGPMKESLECLDSFEDQCPDQVGEMKAGMQSKGNQPDPDAVRNFISVECPKIPATFTTNKCVKEKTGSTELEQCYSQVARTYGKSEAEMKSCPAYLAGKKCIDDIVGKCGAAEARVLVRASHMLIAGLPTHCEENSALSVQASLATLFTMLVLCLAHFKF